MRQYFDRMLAMCDVSERDYMTGLRVATNKQIRAALKAAAKRKS